MIFQMNNLPYDVFVNDILYESSLNVIIEEKKDKELNTCDDFLNFENMDI